MDIKAEQDKIAEWLKIGEAAIAAAHADTPRTGGMNAAWAAGYGAEGDYTPEARVFCTFYMTECDKLGKKIPPFKF